ncbi:hypothetical protein PLESTF_000442700 [Pleodorina starrii]|nr:hypothetical protein PLESTF_000442700 [Pleodorina starrii]
MDGVANAPGPVKWGAAGAVVGATAAGVVGPLGAVAGAVIGAQAAATMAAVLDPPPTSRLHGAADYETVEAPVAGPDPEAGRSEGAEAEPALSGLVGEGQRGPSPPRHSAVDTSAGAGASSPGLG